MVHAEAPVERRLAKLNIIPVFRDRRVAELAEIVMLQAFCRIHPRRTSIEGELAYRRHMLIEQRRWPARKAAI
jgi:hypothetical protein